MKRVLGRPDSTTLLFSALAGAPATVDGSVLVEEGVLHSEALTLRGRDAVALTKGSVDLPAWQLDSITEIHRDADPKKAYLTVRLRGPLDEPNVAIDGQPFQRQQAPAEPPADGEAPAPGEPQPLKPEEVFKDGLKNLLKGLDG